MNSCSIDFNSRLIFPLHTCSYCNINYQVSLCSGPTVSFVIKMQPRKRLSLGIHFSLTRVTNPMISVSRFWMTFVKHCLVDRKSLLC